MKMAYKSILLLGIFLVVATKVQALSYDEDLKIVVNYANPSVPNVNAPPVTPVVTTPTPPTPPYQSPPIVKAPSPPPIVKTPPYQSPPIVKPPSPPVVKTPPYQSPPIVKPPTPPPIQTPAPYQPPAPAPTPIVKSIKDCIPLCGYRCKLHSRNKLCMRACITCCDRCKCVPPGTYGNREKCGKCYTDMLTHGNKFKCP